MGNVEWLPSQKGDQGFLLKLTSASAQRLTTIHFLCDPNFEGIGVLTPGPNGGAGARLLGAGNTHNLFRRAQQGWQIRTRVEIGLCLPSGFTKIVQQLLVIAECTRLTPVE
jgi:hypothetical protein